MLMELRCAVRTLLKSPGFTAAAVLTLALGAGGNAAVFSVIDQVLLRPLPFGDPDRLVLITGSPEPGFAHTPLSFPEFTDVREQSRSLETVAAWTSFTDTRLNLTDGEHPEEVQYALVSANFFETLAIRASAGRLFRPYEDRPGDTRPVIVTRRFWERRFGADTVFSDQALTLDGSLYEVVGVLPASFRFVTFPREPEIYLPLGLDPVRGRQYSRGSRYLGVIGRLRPGVTAEQAQAEQATIISRLAHQHPGFYRGRSFDAIPLHEQVTRRLQPALLALWGAVVFVLLIACANVAGLLLVRARSRRRELAIRSALGGSRFRVVRPLLFETLVIAVAGGTSGVLLAVWGLDLVSFVTRTAPNPFIPYAFSADQFTVNGRVFVLTMISAMLAGVFASILPVTQALKADLGQPLKPVGADAGPPDRTRARAVLVIGEIAISLVLLTGAALMVKSLLHLQRVEPGFQPESVLTFDVALPASTYAGSEQVGAFYTSLIERARLLPGVSAAAATAVLPFSGADQSCGFFIEGRPVTSPDETPDAHHRAITPGYFAAMRIPVVAGRAFTDEDSARSRRVAIVNETMARQFWRVQKPLGARLALNIEVWRYYQDRAPELDIAGGMREIVGIVADVRHSSLDAQAVPEVYVPHAQLAPRRMSVLVRTAGSPALLAEALRGEVRALDRNQAISNVRAMTDLLAASLAGPRLSTRLVAAFSGVAVALAVVGLYGILAFTVTQRRQEIGVRIALGATRTDVLGLIFRQGVALIAVGLVIGTAAAAAVTRLLRGLLFEVSPTDPGTFVLTALLLTAVGLVACYLPARRAAALDPIEALRYD